MDLPLDLSLEILTYLPPREIRQFNHDRIWIAIIAEIFHKSNKDIVNVCESHLKSFSCCMNFQQVYWNHLDKYMDPDTFCPRVLTDRERLLSACSALCKNRIETRIDFTCCSTCAHSGMHDEIELTCSNYDDCSRGDVGYCCSHIQSGYSWGGSNGDVYIPRDVYRRGMLEQCFYLGYCFWDDKAEEAKGCVIACNILRSRGFSVIQSPNEETNIQILPGFCTTITDSDEFIDQYIAEMENKHGENWQDNESALPHTCIFSSLAFIEYPELAEDEGGTHIVSASGGWTCEDDASSYDENENDDDSSREEYDDDSSYASEEGMQLRSGRVKRARLED